MTARPRVKVETVNAITVATVSDSSIIDPMHVEDLRTTLSKLVGPESHGSLVLDLSQLEHLSSAGLGVLITLHDRCREANGKLVLVGLQNGIAKLLSITKLDDYLTITEGIDDAVANVREYHNIL